MSWNSFYVRQSAQHTSEHFPHPAVRHEPRQPVYSATIKERIMSTKDQVLNALQSSGENYISGEALSEKLGVSRTAVWKAIRALREEGYVIKAVTNRGYRLIHEDNTITEENLRAHLYTGYRNNALHIYDKLDSTNIRAKQLALENAPHGTTVIAMQQTAGRGRLGRNFFSPREGIYLSIIIKPTFDLSKSVLVTAAASVAVAEAIEKVCGRHAMIKWVNDVYLDGKKVCGILTEGITDFETGHIESLVIGIGLNTSLEGFPDELLDVAGAVTAADGDYSRSELAAEIISRTLDFAESIESRSFIHEYRSRSMVVGKDIRVFTGIRGTSPDGAAGGRPARVLDIDDNGGLEVIYTDGSRETLTSGEISVRLNVSSE